MFKVVPTSVGTVGGGAASSGQCNEYPNLMLTWRVGRAGSCGCTVLDGGSVLYS